MDEIVRIPKDHLIVVCDARKALMLKNIGAVAQPELEIVGHFETEDRGEKLIDSDRPGRRGDGGAHAASGGPRSAMETRDVSEILASSFANSLAGHLSRLHRKSPIGRIIAVAPPSFLGLLRKELHAELKSVPTSEIAKHLTELPVSALQKALLENLP